MENVKTLTRAMNILDRGTHGKKSYWTPSEIRKKLHMGLSYKSFENVKKRLGLEDKVVARLLEASLRTMARRKKDNKLSSGESDRLLRVARIMAIAEEVFDYDTPKAVSWLKTGNRALDGEKPFELLGSEVGARQIEELLMQIEYGLLS